MMRMVSDMAVGDTFNISARVSGVDAVVREFNRKADGVEDALTEGTIEAAEYLQEKIEDKFGTYQPGWAHLKPETISKEEHPQNIYSKSVALIIFFVGIVIHLNSF